PLIEKFSVGVQSFNERYLRLGETSWARLHKCYCRVKTILRDTWVIMHAHAMEEYYTLPFLIRTTSIKLA
ncbi:MAG: hypothetical protein QMD12_03670, partial [Candidatus Aenigmarchaeota archaeon]|nr:hypothetical protein [Candidatus Aenigmarchaeota archaeon]